MAQKYKVFYNDSVLNVRENPSLNEITDSSGKSLLFVEKLQKWLAGEFAESWEIQVPKFSLFLEGIKHLLKPIDAAGGLVKNAQGNLLIIHRLDKWDLPKGKVEKGESFEEAALREVEEETGVTGLKLVEKKQETYHIYPRNEMYWFKTTHWYNMQTDFDGELIPQNEEGIGEVKWATAEEIPQIMAETYGNIALLLKG